MILMSEGLEVARQVVDLCWLRTGENTQDAGIYRVGRVKMGSASRPTYFRYAAWAGKSLIRCFDDAKSARAACVEHFELSETDFKK